MYNGQNRCLYAAQRVGNKFSIKTWKFDHIKDDRRKPIDMDEKSG